MGLESWAAGRFCFEITTLPHVSNLSALPFTRTIKDTLLATNQQIQLLHTSCLLVWVDIGLKSRSSRLAVCNNLPDYIYHGTLILASLPRLHICLSVAAAEGLQSKNLFGKD